MSRRKLTFWALLVAAVLALSRFLAAWREWRAAATLDHAAAVLVLGAALLAAMGWLGFILYEVDRAAGRIRHQVGVYEWVIAMRRPFAPPPAGPSLPGPAARTGTAQTGRAAR
jgi:hypothetical protein